MPAKRNDHEKRFSTYLICKLSGADKCLSRLTLGQIPITVSYDLKYNYCYKVLIF